MPGKDLGGFGQGKVGSFDVGAVVGFEQQCPGAHFTHPGIGELDGFEEAARACDVGDALIQAVADGETWVHAPSGSICPLTAAAISAARRS